ncbi:MAG: hypothetical protein NTY35_02410 [Planctomycetota bacterium]|nr:hypothetical protein [Planctomycetota bacterium]
MKFSLARISALAFLSMTSSSAWSQSFQPFCFGDAGTATIPCPCGNNSAPMSGGCLNSLGLPGLLVGSSPSGVAHVGADIAGFDRVTLTGSMMPNSACVYFQGSPLAPVLFGDGIRCVNNPFQLQLGTRTNAGGSSFVGGAPGPAISLQGFLVTPLPAPCQRAYQCWYRNSNPTFCTPATFNMTNGLLIDWQP